MSGIFKGYPGANLDPCLDYHPSMLKNCKELNRFHTCTANNNLQFDLYFYNMGKMISVIHRFSAIFRLFSNQRYFFG